MFNHDDVADRGGQQRYPPRMADGDRLYQGYFSTPGTESWQQIRDHRKLCKAV